MSHRQYIGDAVYAEVDDMSGGLVLTTEDGIEVTNRIVLEPEVLETLEGYLRRRRMAVQEAINARAAARSEEG